MVNLAKRSVVKHRTRSDPSARPKNTGFNVGATNVPNGAYIGRAKKHKAELIHKAKVKKAYFQMLKHDQQEQSDARGPEETQELGRFASETADNDTDATEAPRRVAPEKPKAKKLPYFYRAPKNKAPKEAAPPRTREQALEDRAARQAKWHRPSPSRLGRQRGQPDLGARMEVMLEKIQRQRT
ncbi:hypothetical protein MCAP1_000500 [Malassezia caprae]|uniref:rRNA-processing protein FYV7 n=1 Tax=Malassezia caprae TaxID=1381934 RepID=A0AAF0E4Z9_9BASI|nr:hypothetical protein MCAP1_000500 [Malassezia caprae]